jgi:hypothetical protein
MVLAMLNRSHEASGRDWPFRHHSMLRITTISEVAVEVWEDHILSYSFIHRVDTVLPSFMYTSLFQGDQKLHQMFFLVNGFDIDLIGTTIPDSTDMQKKEMKVLVAS